MRRRIPLLSALLLPAGLCFIAAGSPRSVAQTAVLAAAQDEPSIASFSAPARASLDRLKQLNELPVGAWRYHTGDLPHGEDPALDDSAWPTLALGASASTDSTWYRLRVTLPATLGGYSLRGTRVLFQFKVRYHGPITQIVYFDGRRVAMGEDLEPIELFHNARPGSSVLIAVKLPRSSDIKRYMPSVFTVEFAPDRPNPETLRTELVTAAALAPGHQPLLDRAALLPWSALAAGRAQFDAAIRRSEAALAPLRPALQRDTIDLIGNSHIDAAWLWPVSETMDVVKRTFGTTLQLMHEYPALKYTQSAAAYHEWMQEKYPFQFEEIKQRVAERRWEIVGGMWVEPDLNMPDGESIARQLLVGTRWFKQNLNADVKVGWNPDSFGYPAQLPQIYAKAGIDVFVTQKMKWNDTNQLPLKTFWWQSPDGSRVLTYFPHDYNRGTEPLRLASDLQTAQRLAPGSDTLMHLYGVGDHGGGPTRVMIDQAERWMQPGKVFPRQQFVFAEDFFRDLKTKVSDPAASPTWNYTALADGLAPLPAPPAGRVSIPVWNDELYLEFHRGIYTSQAQHKRHMRQSEEWTLNAEKFATLAWLGGASYPADQLNEAWKKVLFNQFHDLAAGSGNAATYKDAERDYAAVYASTSSVSESSKSLIASHIDTTGPAGSVPVLVFNPMAWDRRDPVEVTVEMPRAEAGRGVEIVDSTGKPVPTQILSSQAALGQYRLLLRPEVPSFGYTVLHALYGKAAPAPAQAKVLDNGILRVEVDPATGCMTHLVSKSTGFDSIAAGACANQLQLFQDTPTDYDAWNIDPGTLDRAPILLSTADSVELTESGPLRSTLRVVRHYGGSRFEQRISLLAGADTVEIVNSIDWHERHLLLKAAFPLAASGPTATFETPYGSIARPTTRTNSVDKAKFEVPALRWADLGDGEHGLSLLNESKYGYDAVGNTLRLSLLRGSTYPDPEMDQGHHEFTFALYPHAGPWQTAETVHRGYELNYPLLAAQAVPHPGTLPAQGSFFGLAEPGLSLSAVKKTEDGYGLLVRVYEWQGKPHNARLRVPLAPTHATVASLLETSLDQPVEQHGNEISFPIKPFEILTLRLDFDRAPNSLWEAALPSR